jgi:hypothetical protein
MKNWPMIANAAKALVLEDCDDSGRSAASAVPK